jgi:CRP-like cAMP-binding protein
LAPFCDCTTIAPEGVLRTIKSPEFPGDAKIVAAGTTIFKLGDPPDCMYSVIEGQVDIFVRGELVDTVSAGGIFGEMAVIENDRRAATAVAKTELRIVSIDQRQFLALIQESPNFALHVMRILSDRVRRLDERLSRVPRP